MVRGLIFGGKNGGGKISEGNGIPPGTSSGTGIVSWTGMSGALKFPAVDPPGILPAGANSPPMLPGLPAGQRGCFAGSQSALRRPLAFSWRARSMISLVVCADFVSAGGSGICRCSVAICAWTRSPRPSARAIAVSPLIFTLNSTGRP
jgi:hypothetical protein